MTTPNFASIYFPHTFPCCIFPHLPALGPQLRNALYGTGGGTNASSVVYGYARANLRPQTFTTGISFRLQGSHIRLFINDQNILDFVAGPTVQLVSPCLTLSSNTAHEIYVYFAANVRSSFCNSLSI